MQDTANFTKRCDLLAPKVIKALESRRFDAYYCRDEKAALDKALELIPQEAVVSWGGSVTVQELGLIDAVKARGTPHIDRDTAKTPEERMELMRSALTCDAFLTSVNAMSEDGQFVNIDGMGNRVAAITFGPKRVIVIVGMNKMCKTLEDAVARVRTYASPMNAMRFSLDTPCSVTGSCGDCKSGDSICSYISITRKSNIPGRIKIILVGKELGY